MIVTRRVLGKTYKTLALNLCRNVQTTQVIALRAGVNKSRRVEKNSRNLLLQQRLMKDSDFVDVNDDIGDYETKSHPDFLEEAYHQQISEFKDRTKIARKIMMKKFVAKRPKEPNMLTFNERQHIIFLHKSDPLEWSVEQLSQSFPALPWVIKKILKNKWTPENVEKIKMMDEAVLENWKKLKENKLEASQELLDHLQKFIDKRDNLEIQMKNPKFFHLPEMKKKLEWKSGVLNSFLLRYEKELERLHDNHENENGNTDRRIPGDATYSISAGENAMEPVNASVGESEERLLLQEGTTENPKFQKRKRGKPVTLELLKEDIFKKADHGNDSISPLEEAIVHKTLTKSVRSKSEILKSDELLSRDNEIKSPEVNPVLSNRARAGDTTPEEGRMSASRESAGRRRKPSSQKENVEEETKEPEDYPNTFNVTELGSKLFGAVEEKEPEASARKTVKTVKAVNHFNTEKDTRIFQQHEKLLSETVFWNTRERGKSLDAGFASVNTSPSPHIASHVKTYFTYDYPLKIDIPADKRKKGKLYRVKDCYYDDAGKFLYRVPGMAE